LSATLLAAVKPVPVIDTEVPGGPLDGLNEESVGTGEAVTVNDEGDEALPPAVVTVHRPLVAPDGTVVEIDVAELTVNEALVPFSVTELAPMRFVPVSVTGVPTGPLDGLTFVRVGVGAGPVVSVSRAKP
jgi:hypothetical protein